MVKHRHSSELGCLLLAMCKHTRMHTLDRQFNESFLGGTMGVGEQNSGGDWILSPQDWVHGDAEGSCTTETPVTYTETGGISPHMEGARKVRCCQVKVVDCLNKVQAF